MNDHEDEADELDDFKVWECPECGWLMNDEAYMSIIVEIECMRCHRAKIGSFTKREFISRNAR